TEATSYIDVHLAVLDLDWVDLRGENRRQAGHRAGLEVEPRAVLRALDLQVEQLAAAEQEVLVRAHVVDGVEVAVLRVREADLGALGDHPFQRADRKLVDRGDADPSQAATPARSPPECAPPQRGCGRGPGRRNPRRAFAWPPAAECRETAGRRDGSGR